MRVLIVHNYYQTSSPSGENSVVDAEIELLGNAGLDVRLLRRDSDDISAMSNGKRIAVGAAAIYGLKALRDVDRLLAVDPPDVVHIHNVYPLISPAVLRPFRRAGIPIVQTVHNYRHTCINGLHFRDGGVCTDCIGRRVATPGVLHGCYRGSWLQSVPMALSQALHRRNWGQAERFIALTPFMANLLKEASIPADRITVRPSWVPDNGFAPLSGNDALFIGRLDEAKGVRLLLDAWSSSVNPERRNLHIVGDGPLAPEVISAATQDDTIVFHGRLSSAEVLARIERAAFIVVPSIWFEGFPLVVAEAFSKGRPVLVTGEGSVASAVPDQAGWSFRPDVRDLAAKLDGISQHAAAAKSLPARFEFERSNSPVAALRSLTQIYAAALNREVGDWT